MIIKYTDEFLLTLKHCNVRIRKAFKQRLIIFIHNPNDSQLRNHLLRNEYVGKRSIDITADWRAIFEMIEISDEVIIYFTALGTHKNLYN